MKFEYYNPSDETRSCVVRTMTKLSGKEYDTVKTELIAIAENMGFDSYNNETVFEKYMAENDIFKFKEYGDTKVGELNLENGTYCVFSTDQNGFYHLFPVIDNVIYDRRDDSRELYVIAVYKMRVDENVL